MGSSCIFKKCRKCKNVANVQFHRIHKQLEKLGIREDFLESQGTRKLTRSSRICTYHLKYLESIKENIDNNNNEVFSRSFVSEGESPPPSDIHQKIIRTISMISNYSIGYRGDTLSSMIADASRENCNDEINMAAASTSDLKISTDAPSQKEEAEEDVENEGNLVVEAPPKVTEEVGSDKKPEEPPNPPSTPPTNGDIHREAVEGGSKEGGNDGHISSGDESPKLVINETCEKKDARNLLKKEPASINTETIPSIAQDKSGENSSPKSPSLKRPVTEDSEVVESVPKRPRLREDLDSTSHLSIAQLDSSLSQIRNEIENIGVEISRKEDEWNTLIRLQKRKEEFLAILERRRSIWTIKQEEGSRSSAFDEREENLAAIASQNIYNSHLPLIMMKHMLGENFMNQIPPPPLPSNRPPSRHRDSSSSNGPKAPSPNNISIIDIHTNNSRSSSLSDVPQVSISPEAHSKLGKHLNSVMSMKPILPKPMNNVGPISNHIGNSPLSYPSGMGPQGPTVSVNQIIAAHRRENPNVPPISETSVLCRGAKRGAWRHKYEGDKRGSPREPDRPSSVSSSNNENDLRLNSLNSKGHLSNVNNSLLAMNDPSVSYKDVLLQFAQLTQQTEKSPGSPQISIIPVSSSDTSSRKFEHTPDSTSVSRELSIPSQASNQSPSLEGSSALAKLLLESGAGNHGNSGKNSAVDLSSYGSSPDSLTLSALLSGGTITTHKEKTSSSSQMDGRPKKNPSDEAASNPKCQGCHKQRAQFVCAGCSNQWYCSRSCQVTAWEHHSQNCNS